MSSFSTRRPATVGDEPVVAAGGVGARVVHGSGRRTRTPRRGWRSSRCRACTATPAAAPCPGRTPRTPRSRPSRHPPSPDAAARPGRVTTTSAPRRRSRGGTVRAGRPVHAHHQAESAAAAGLDTGQRVLHHGGVLGAGRRAAGPLPGTAPGPVCPAGAAGPPRCRPPRPGRARAPRRAASSSVACRDAETAAHGTPWRRSARSRRTVPGQAATAAVAQARGEQLAPCGPRRRRRCPCPARRPGRRAAARGPGSAGTRRPRPAGTGRRRSADSRPPGRRGAARPAAAQAGVEGALPGRGVHRGRSR